MLPDPGIFVAATGAGTASRRPLPVWLAYTQLAQTFGSQEIASGLFRKTSQDLIYTDSITVKKCPMEALVFVACCVFAYTLFICMYTSAYVRLSQEGLLRFLRFHYMFREVLRL